MKKLLFALPVFVLLANCDAQATKKDTPTTMTKTPTDANTSVVVLDYNSVCCGPPSEMPVVNFIQNFVKANKTAKPVVYKKSGLGREGEFKLYIMLNGFNPMSVKPFLAGLQKTVSDQNNSRNKSSDGTINFNERLLSETEWNQTMDESKNSRFPISTYKY